MNLGTAQEAGGEPLVPGHGEPCQAPASQGPTCPLPCPWPRCFKPRSPGQDMVVQAPPHRPEPQPQGGGPLPKGSPPCSVDCGLSLSTSRASVGVFVIFSLCFIPCHASPADMPRISVLRTDPVHLSPLSCELCDLGWPQSIKRGPGESSQAQTTAVFGGPGTAPGT